VRRPDSPASDRAVRANSGFESRRASVAAPETRTSVQADAVRSGVAGNVDSIEKARLAGGEGQDERMGAIPRAEEADAVQQRAGGDASRGEDDVAAGSEILCAVDAVGVSQAHGRHTVAQLRRVDDKPAEHLAAEAAQGGGGEDSFRSATTAHHGVNPGAAHSRG